MAAKFVVFERVSHRYDSMPKPLMQSMSLSFSAGWTGVVGANGAGKTTLLKLATGLLEPVEGRIQLPGIACYCAQRTDDAPAQFGSLIGATDRLACEVKGRLGIEGDWADRWESLSHGERKRAQIAVMLWRQPAVLALDEPTNHIDTEARAMLVAALRDYRGIGLLVSHDRDLLDLLCRQCLFLDPPDAVLRPGDYSAGRRKAKREEDCARTRKEVAKRHVARLRIEAQRRLSKARAAENMRSKKGLDPRDHDRRARIDRARLTGADGSAARLAGRMQSRLERARQTEESIKIRKQYDLGIWIGGERCKRDTLLRLPSGSVALGRDRELHFPELVMLPSDRIALTGANGAGKSTLVRHILEVIDLPAERLTYLPQEIDVGSSRRILAEARRQPREILGSIMTVISRLGSRPARLLESVEPSPGELRKLLLALGIARQPHLIVMDEPTNHLDLPSIECLERALEDCPCALLLVSHDERFLRRLTVRRWHIAPLTASPPGHMLLRVL
jgi:ATPase subunit of ABC transporter with duplicated ATPase domains